MLFSRIFFFFFFPLGDFHGVKIYMAQEYTSEGHRVENKVQYIITQYLNTKLTLNLPDTVQYTFGNL